MQILLCSPRALCLNETLNLGVIQVLIQMRQSGCPVAVISNHPKPTWFDTAFSGSNVQFLQVRGRQDGSIILQNAEKLNCKTYECLVLAASSDDLKMGKNGKAVLIAAGWSADPEINKFGIKVDTPDQLNEVIALLGKWKGAWWFAADGSNYSVRALANLSTLYVDNDQAKFATALTSLVKSGGTNLTALLAIVARSLLVERQEDNPTMWAVYPSSASQNNDTEVLSNFTHRLRTTVSKVKFAKEEQPLFIRHKASQRRCKSHTITSRTDPTEQLTTIHLNPAYRNKINGRHVAVIDDCTTYGVSFGVAAAFLRAAGAKGMTGIALGKFGNKLQEYDIEITGDPFAPIGASDFKYKGKSDIHGTINEQSRQDLLQLFKIK
jgi:hypothetical protein